MAVHLVDDGMYADNDSRQMTPVLSDPASDDEPYAGIRDGVRIWTGPMEGLEATAVRFVRHRFCPHTHDTLMLGLVETGVKEFKREARTYVAPPGSISIVNPGDPHTGYRLEGEVLCYRALYVEPGLLAESIGATLDIGKAIGFRSGVVDDPQTFRALLRAHDGIVRGAPRLAGDSLALTALDLLVSRHGEGRHRPCEHASASRQVRHARELIETRYADDLSVAAIAEAVALSPFHLMRQFRRLVGVPMHAYQLQIRVERAKRLLALGGVPAQVALDVGFADQSHFTRRFKAIVGASPASYQRDIQR